MMEAFLEQCANYLFNTYRDGIGGLCLVFPNRRAALFLKKHLTQLIEKPVWLPRVFSIEDFIFHLSGFTKIDPINLLFELYEVHKSIEKENARSVDEFLNWGPSLLHDLNEIDEYLVDSKQLFGYITEVKALSVWNLNRNPLTDYEKNFIRFYNSLGDYHRLLSARLIDKKQAYQGLAARRVAENIQRDLTSIHWKKTIFMGFNALNKAEKQIITYLLQSEKAEILWDCDAYYLKDGLTNLQEAGFFLDKHFSTRAFQNPKWIFNPLKEDQKTIEILGVPGKVLQTKACGQILDELALSGDALDQTAVVLADEQLLIPQLNSLPPSVNSFNVTMGLPLNYTTAYQLFDAIFKLNLNAQSYYKTRQFKTQRYHLNDILKILRNPFIEKCHHTLIGDSTSLNRIITQNLLKSNKIFYSRAELAEKITSTNQNVPLLDIFFETGDITAVMDTIHRFIQLLKNGLSDDKNGNNFSVEIEKEYLFEFFKLFNKLGYWVSNTNYFGSLQTIYTVFNKMCASVTLPFYGEPLHGLQVMGMLETRTLDFSNLIILSMNEDIIPATRRSQSFIPYEIKKDFQLPTYRDRDAIYAYHFYRLLQRSKKVFLLYNTEPDAVGGGDKSRFISQIIRELPAYNPGITIHESLLDIKPKQASPIDGISIEKTPAIINLLRKKAKRGFSATTLIAYKNCSLKFYFKEIAGIKEEEQADETIDKATLGTVVHHILFRLYKPFINKTIEVNQLREQYQSIKKVALESFKEKVKDGETRFGKNLLIINAAISQVSKFLRYELNLLSNEKTPNHDIEILTLEKPFKTTYEFACLPRNETIPITLTGVIDRMDKDNGHTRIIDYKTGSIQNAELHVKDWDRLINESKLDKAFQLLYYSLLINKDYPFEKSNTSAYGISFRDPSRGYIKLTMPDQDYLNPESVDNFQGVLNEIFTQIFNPNLSFSQTDQTEQCEFCPYRNICNK